VHLASLPSADEPDGALAEEVTRLLRLRDLVLKQLEPFRVKKHHPLDARVLLHLPEAERGFAQDYGTGNLADLFIVSAVEILPGSGEATAEVSEAPGVKCPRCWKRSPGTSDPRHPDLCPRCCAALDVIEGGRA